MFGRKGQGSEGDPGNIYTPHAEQLNSSNPLWNDPTNSSLLCSKTLEFL